MFFSSSWKHPSMFSSTSIIKDSRLTLSDSMNSTQQLSDSKTISPFVALFLFYNFETFFFIKEFDIKESMQAGACDEIRLSVSCMICKLFSHFR